MNYIPTNNKDFEAFASEYHKEEKEILILTSDDSGGSAIRCGSSWAPITDFLAYIDLSSNDLKKGDGRVTWLLSEEEKKAHTLFYPYYFKRGSIYRLKVRDLIDRTVPEGRLPSFYNRFMVVEVLEENVENDELLAILAEYRKPVKVVDEILGELELNKDMEMFEGAIDWLGEEITIYLEVNIDSKASWTKAIKALRTLVEQQEQQDSEFRNFAAEHLTDLANDWRDDKETPEISKADFAARISLSELTITSSGNFTAYYDDDDMFLRHAITVSGNIKKGLKSATIEG
ncbi:DUF2262 domain-containing protein [Bacteroides sp. 224]|uniref:DUF2262 domain-containing protein n=1 Tax=Bacteroides sp. 224 TaxID=2302936 RepID=UPI0013D57693|nr:DUF2262 domain-containing protein [Bacteroides sp. 224]NDV66712.1 DUF2262 domain-containing protein [Bacteroides sp. 224]